MNLIDFTSRLARKDAPSRFVEIRVEERRGEEIGASVNDVRGFSPPSQRGGCVFSLFARYARASSSPPSPVDGKSRVSHRILWLFLRIPESNDIITMLRKLIFLPRSSSKM